MLAMNGAGKAGQQAERSALGDAGKVSERDLAAGGGEAASSRILGQNLGDAGFVRAGDTAAHHIVAGRAPQAAEARAVLDQFGIGINDAANGVFLPRNLASDNPTGAIVHSTLHTNAYYSSVNELLGAAGSRREALDALAYIRDQLLGGGMP